ncbi:LacI family transcriptional regulator [Bacteroidia bacterium]|nr:LacI family transcriptional regulator [Bacteroidia bacterium]
MKKVTIKDLAKALNVSTSTVSRALADHQDISQSTKKKVKLLADELNYTINMHAKLFRNQNSGLIALVLPEINMFFTPRLIEGINKTLNNSKYTLITFVSKDLLEKEKEIIKQCLAWNVEGVLISLSKESTNIDHLAKLTQANIECVLLDKTNSEKDNQYATVGINGASISYDATMHLIQNGHKNIIGIFGNPALSITQNRLQGFKNAFNEKKITLPTENIVLVEKSKDLDFILPHILRHNKNVTAIFTMSDELLAATHHNLRAADKRVPEDISIMAISDGVYPYLLHPKISHIKHSGYRLGRKSSTLLIKILEDKKERCHEVIKTKTIILDSVRDLT